MLQPALLDLPVLGVKAKMHSAASQRQFIALYAAACNQQATSGLLLAGVLARPAQTSNNQCPSSPMTATQAVFRHVSQHAAIMQPISTIMAWFHTHNNALSTFSDHLCW